MWLQVLECWKQKFKVTSHALQIPSGNVTWARMTQQKRGAAGGVGGSGRARYSTDFHAAFQGPLNPTGDCQVLHG